jgi:hypothetical protein
MGILAGNSTFFFQIFWEGDAPAPRGGARMVFPHVFALYNSAMRFPPFALALACIPLLAGCVTRTVTITSEPAGAKVYLNEREVGVTPLTCGFLFYGVYDVRLEKDGCKALWTTAKAKQPWWEYPGVDLLAQATGPKKVNLAWHFKLDPQLPAARRDPAEVTARAREMREINRLPADKADALLHADGKQP